LSDASSWTRWAFERKRTNAQSPAVKEDRRFNKSHPPWTNDPLTLTLIAVVIAASIAMYFILMRGWFW
jgi:hypothetical protein